MTSTRRWNLIAMSFSAAVAASLVLPAIDHVRANARQNASLENLRKIGRATTDFATAKKHLPYGTFHDKESPTGTCDPRYHQFYSGWTAILPYIGEEELFNKYNPTLSYRDESDVDGDGWSNKRITETRPSVYVDPAMPIPEAPPHSGWSSYAWSGGNNAYNNGGNLTGGSGGTHDGAIVNAKQGAVQLGDITDGVAFTFLAGEAHYTLVGMTHSGANDESLKGKPFTGQIVWGAGHYPRSHLSTNTPVNTHQSTHSNPNLADWYKQGAFGFRSAHPGGCHFVFCDGSTRMISEKIAMPIYRGLGSRAGGELIAAEDFAVADFAAEDIAAEEIK